MEHFNLHIYTHNSSTETIAIEQDFGSVDTMNIILIGKGQLKAVAEELNRLAEAE